MPTAAIRALALALSLLLAACAYTPTSSLHYDPIPSHAPSFSPYRLAVLPLEEGRPPRRYPGLQGNLFKTYIPLLPYVKVEYERLDESRLLHLQNQGGASDGTERFTVAFAREIARDLDASGLFREVSFVPDVESAEAYDLVLAGTLTSSAFDIYTTSYMLGMAGVLLWFLPIPLGKDEATVAADLEITDRSGSVVWRDSFSEHASRMFTLYNSAGESTSSQYRIEIKRYGSNDLGIDGDSFWAYHAEALRSGMGAMKSSLAKDLPSPSMP